ncbi:sulfite exporter TauE/SafE family protein [Paradesulfitobacterium ferrireducens]|uniref:sulfite exporter TauE/SafE family protein n=1 Tax=Paradesulfitobacterium ferrireducens TaxID=2816476 RepID=UPI001F419587|nr:sulfite exporter TauE/SafE family protein [Paradesulfitobacterium ferrireducens]
MLLHILLIFIFSILAGFVGSLLGLGGGIIVIPTLTLALGLDIHEAIGASIISVIATSSGAAMAYVRDKLTNIRLGMFLETATTIGAITGAYIAEFISIKALYITFALLMLYSAWNMFRSSTNSKVAKVQAHPLADRLKLNPCSASSDSLILF